MGDKRLVGIEFEMLLIPIHSQIYTLHLKNPVSSTLHTKYVPTQLVVLLRLGPPDVQPRLPPENMHRAFLEEIKVFVN